MRIILWRKNGSYRRMRCWDAFLFAHCQPPLFELGDFHPCNVVLPGTKEGCNKL